VTCLTDIRIRQLIGPRKAWLSLVGTVLTYCDRTWSRETAIDIPVELISIKDKKRFMGTRLIGALCWLLFSLMAGAIMGAIVYRPDTPCTATTEIIFFVLWMAVAIVPFVVLLIRFFFRQRTVSLVIAPHNSQITFWVLKKGRVVVDNLLSEIQTRRAYVDERISYPQSSCLGNVLERPWKRTVVLICLFALPALFVEEPWLFLLCIAPIAMHIWSVVTSVDQPRLFRKAVRACLRKQWNDAQAMISELLERSPSYMPAHLLLINICLRLCRFGEAESVLSRIQSDLNPEAVQEIQTDIIQRRRIYERKQMSIQPTNGQVVSESSPSLSHEKPSSHSPNAP